MSEKEKMSSEELKKIAAGVSGNDKKPPEKLDSYLHRSGPYQCTCCGSDYYVGDEEIDLGMCQKCWHNPSHHYQHDKNQK